MRFGLKLRDIPGRLIAGVYVLHAGMEKWNAEPDHATAVHGMAAGAYPFLAEMSPATFVHALAAGELAVGAALLVPAVPTALAGAALTAFATGLLGLYARTPALRRPGSVWPTPAGIGVSKDVWLFAIGVGLTADAFDQRRRRR